MHVENQTVINALVGKPVAWSGLAEPDEKVLTILRKRTLPASPVNLGRLAGYTRIQMNEILLRLKRRGLVECLARGRWIALQ
ncbi:hypothetical protein ABUK73_05010 [Agrobacterium sp. BA1120]|uniref:hypothetical protein n=1 Tax=Agrobacterium sp. BA1120 TaxID=3228927 RepID=UPI00336ABBB2